MAKDKVKIIKNKKKFNFASVWKFVRTLFKNDAVVEVATTTKWYWSLIVFVFALVISVLPSTVSQATAQGRNFVSGSNASYSDPYINGLYDYYNSDTENTNIVFDTATSKLSSTTNSSGYYDTDDYALSDGTRAPKPLYSYSRQVENSGLTTTTNYLDIYVYYTGSSGTLDLNLLLSNIQATNTNFADGYTTNTDVKYTRQTPFILFTDDGFYAVNYSSQGSTSISGNFAHMLEAFNFTGSTYTFKDVLGYRITDNLSVSDMQTAIFNNFLTWCDYTYLDARFTSTWVTFGIYCGVNGSIMLLMGLIIWLMCRGKNNPNNKLKIWETYSMGFWASLSPAILSLFGFLMPSLGMMLFIMLYAFRIMFLSMKQLRPMY